MSSLNLAIDDEWGDPNDNANASACLESCDTVGPHQWDRCRVAKLMVILLLRAQ